MMTNEEYMEEVLNIKSFRLQRFEALMSNGFEIINSTYGFKVYVSDCLELSLGHERICFTHSQIVFDKGTIVIPFGDSTYRVGACEGKVEGISLDINSLSNYLQFVGFKKKLDSNRSIYTKESLVIKTRDRSSNLIILFEDLLIEAPIRNLILKDTGLFIKAVNTYIKIV